MILAPLVLIVASRALDAQVPAPKPPTAKSSEKPVRTSSDASPETEARHPLDPLSPDEIRLAVATIRKERQLPTSYRFVTVSLNEPAKALVLHPSADKPLVREAFLVLLDHTTGKGYEAVVNLSTRSVSRFEGLAEGVQPSIMLDEFNECEEAARKCPEFQAAMKKRGITDMSLVMIDAWSAGHYGNEPAADKGKRLVRSLSWVAPSRWTTATPARSRGLSR